MQHSQLQALITGSTNPDGVKTVTVPADLFRHLLISSLKSKGFFDEAYYLANYSDISKAVRSKQISSGADHYFETGYFEGRLPRKMLVDEKFYLENNPDVRDAIAKGKVKTAQEHFDCAGFREGRQPYAGFSMF